MAGRVVAILTGSVLLFASLMKGLALADTTVSPGRVAGDWWLSLAASVFELFLGVWLIAGVFPATVRRVALVCFLGFAGVALYKAVQGEASCGCLGHLQVDPRYTLAVDVVLAAVLWWVGPQRALTTDRGSSLLLLIGMLVLAFGLGFRTYQTATELSRGLVVDVPTHEFGEVGQNEELTHNFTLDNRCSFPVEIVQTTSSCGCTTLGDVGGQQVAPGERLAIPVTLNTGESDEHIVGRITLYCRPVGSSAPPGFYRELRVSAKVQPDYWVRALVADFGEVDHDRPVSRTIEFVPHRKEDARVTEITVGHPAFTAKVLDGQAPGVAQRIEITFHGRHLSASGVSETPVILRTNSTRRPVVSILARASFRSPVTISPLAVVVGSDSFGPITRQVVVEGLRPLRVEELVASSPEVKATVTQVSPTFWRLSLQLSERTQVTGLNGSVRLRVRCDAGSDSAGVREAVIPIHRLTP